MGSGLRGTLFEIDYFGAEYPTSCSGKEHWSERKRSRIENFNRRLKDLWVKIFHGFTPGPLLKW
jgi:hypothetical protein